MKLKTKNKVIEIQLCNSFKDRLLGFMFQKKKITYGKCFPKCNSVHTFFMKQNLDIILCDKDNIIKFIFLNVPKNKIIGPKKEVKYIYELPLDTGKHFKINEIFPIEKESI